MGASSVYSFQSAAISPRPTFVRAVTPDGVYLISSEFTEWGAKTYLRDVETLREMDSLPFTCSVAAICSTDPHLVVCDSILWNRKTGETISLVIRKPIDMQFTANGRYLIAVYADEDSAVAIFDIQENKYVFWYLRHPSRQTCIDIASDGRHFATGAEDGSVTVWNIPEEFWPETVTAPTNTADQSPYTPIMQVYPNPAGASGCTLMIAIKQLSQVDITVRDMCGQPIAKLFSGVLEPGQYPVQWNARKSDGSTVADGVYYCVVKVNSTPFFVPIILRQ